jgi:hypothetical protein
MATVNLGSIKFKWKGTYSGATAYTIDDVVEYNGSSYICILASTGNLPTNATYFEQMSSAGTNGTNGTDLGTTLTTQGDLVYRDGSGLQRLGAGTAGQVLQTGGAGANPSWSTVSSDFVKIAETTATGTGAQVYLQYDMSAYKNVILKYRNLYTSSTNEPIGLRVGYGVTPSYVTSNTYRQLARGSYSDFAGSPTTGTAGGMYLYDWIMMNTAWAQYGSTNNAGFGELEIFHINSTNGLHKPFTFLNGFRENAYRIYVNQGGWLEDSDITDGAITGFEISAGGHNVYGEFTLYGVK